MSDFAFDNSWAALFEPGKSTDYFQFVIPPISMKGYSKTNALWFAEFSRLIYRENKEENPAALPPNRQTILALIACRETCFFSQHSVQCACFEPDDGTWVTLVFRGSHTWQNWFSNLSIFLRKWPEGGKVHQGFKMVFEALWPQIADYLSTRQVPLFYTGHSLGAALAILAATKKTPQAVYAFGAPRVGDKTFVHRFKHIPIYRIVNNQDIIATVLTKSMGFCHVGILHHLNSYKPSFSYWFEPPHPLADHSPINYVIHLQKLISCTSSSQAKK